MGSGELKVGETAELVKQNPMGFSAYSCKILEVRSSKYLTLSAPSVHGKIITLPATGNYQLRYLTNAGYFKISIKISERSPIKQGATITAEIRGGPQPVFFKEYTKTECNIAIRFSSLFNESLRGTGVLLELSGGGAKLSTSDRLPAGDTVRFPLELVGCEDMIVLARVVDTGESEGNKLYSLAFTDMHMRLRRQLMSYIESCSL